MPGIPARGTSGSKPPASPSVTMQYATSTPSSVHVATVPAAPKSTSSGWATITSARCTSSSSSIARPYRVPDGTLRPHSATGTIDTVDATPLWWPPIDPETQRELVAFLTERGVDPDVIAEGITEDSLWELTTESLLATRDDLTADELGGRAGLTPEQLRRVHRALGLRDDSYSSDDVVIATTGAEAIKLFGDEDVALRLLRVIGTSIRRIAEASVAAYIAGVEKPLVDADASVLAHAQAQAGAN